MAPDKQELYELNALDDSITNSLKENKTNKYKKYRRISSYSLTKRFLKSTHYKTCVTDQVKEIFTCI